MENEVLLTGLCLFPCLPCAHIDALASAPLGHPTGFTKLKEGLIVLQQISSDTDQQINSVGSGSAGLKILFIITS